MYVEDSIVRRVAIYDIPLAEVWLSMGQPDMSYEIGGSQVSPVMHVSYYADWDVRVEVMAACANQTSSTFASRPAALCVIISAQ